MRIEISIDDTVSPALREALGAQAIVDANQSGALAAVNAAREYHNEFDAAGGWRSSKGSISGRTGGSEFGADVARAWNFDEAREDGADISNDAPHFVHKVRGGVITPERAKTLTIPVHQTAAGLRAEEYEQTTGNRLFTIRGMDGLFIRHSEGVRMIYRLTASVTQDPWPNALPDEDLLAAAYSEALAETLLSKLQ